MIKHVFSVRNSFGNGLGTVETYNKQYDKFMAGKLWFLLTPKAVINGQLEAAFLTLRLGAN